MPADDAKEISAPDPEQGLTLRQRFFIRHYTDPESPGFGNATIAAELAGYRSTNGRNQLGVQGHLNLKKTKIRSAIEHILDEAGCTFELAAGRLREGMDATVVRDFLRRNGEIVSSEARPDYRERRQAAEFVLKLRMLQQTRPLEQAFESPDRGQSEGEEVPEEVSADRQELRDRIAQLDPIDRELLRALAQKTLRLVQIEKQALIEEKWGKPYSEVENELNQEAGKRTAEIMRQIMGRQSETSVPDC